MKKKVFVFPRSPHLKESEDCIAHPGKQTGGGQEEVEEKEKDNDCFAYLL